MSVETNPQAVRRDKLAALEERGIDPYPARWRVDDHAASLLEAFRDDAEPITARVAGRVVSIRSHGKTSFLHVADATGRIQVYLRQDELGGEAFALLDCLDLGDFVGVGGHLFRTRTGEVTIRATEIAVRSEEHTSELQSRLHLVCRLLLEKKKNEKIEQTYNFFSDGRVRRPTVTQSSAA